MVKYADTVYIIIHVHLDTTFEVLSKVASVSIVTLDVSFSRFTKILENLEEILTRSNTNQIQCKSNTTETYHKIKLLHFLCSLSNFIQLHQVTTWLLAVLYHILYTGKHSSPFYLRPFRHHLSAREFKNVWYYFTLNKTSSAIEGCEYNMVRK